MGYARVRRSVAVGRGYPLRGSAPRAQRIGHAPVSPYERMKNRVFREYDRYWEAAQQMADERNENLSEKIREFIRAYGKGETE